MTNRALPELYRQIKKMVPKIVLRPNVAKRVFSDVRTGVGSTEVDPGSITFLPPPELNSPFPYQAGNGAINNLFSTGDPTDPPNPSRVWNPIGRRVQEPLAVDWTVNPSIYPPVDNAASGSQRMPRGVTYWDRRPHFMENPPTVQIRWNWISVPGYSDYGRPPNGGALWDAEGVFNVDPGIGSWTGPPSGGWPGNFYSWPNPPVEYYSGHFVTGKTLYDPFPYGEELPVYFWADMADASAGGGSDGILWGVEPGGRSPNSGWNPTPTTEPWNNNYGVGVGPGSVNVVSPLSNSIGPIVFKLWWSPDLGENWYPPSYGLGLHESMVGPTQPGPWGPNFEYRYDARLINPFGSWPLEPHAGPQAMATVNGFHTAIMRDAMYQDDVIFKITLETPRPDVWVSFRSFGIGYFTSTMNSFNDIGRFAATPPTTPSPP